MSCWIISIKHFQHFWLCAPSSICRCCSRGRASWAGSVMFRWGEINRGMHGAPGRRNGSSGWWGLVSHTLSHVSVRLRNHTFSGLCCITAAVWEIQAQQCLFSSVNKDHNFVTTIWKWHMFMAFCAALITLWGSGILIQCKYSRLDFAPKFYLLTIFKHLTVLIIFLSFFNVFSSFYSCHLVFT